MDPSSAPARVTAIDLARALAVIGVVFNHVVDGAEGADLLATTSLLSQLNDALYIFRMPALVFMIGIFIPRSVSKRGARRYLAGRTALMIYLYVLWFLIEGLVETLGGSLRNGSRPLYELLFIWRPIAHLWFLPFLVVGTTLVVLARPWVRRPLGVVGFFVLLAITIIAWGWNPPIAGLRGVSLVAFIAAGAGLGLDRLSALMRQPLRRWLVAASVAGCVFLLLLKIHPVPATQEAPTNLPVSLISLAAAACGVVILLSIAVLLSRAPFRLFWLEAIGRQTLPIYLAHVIVVASCRILLVDILGIDSVVLVVLLCVTLGVGVPFAAARASRYLHAEWLFALPDRIGTRLRRPPESRVQGSS